MAGNKYATLTTASGLLLRLNKKWYVSNYIFCILHYYLAFHIVTSKSELKEINLNMN